MQRFPDIVVVSFQCACGEYLSHSTLVANTEVIVICRRCTARYTLAIGELAVDIEIESATETA